MPVKRLLEAEHIGSVFKIEVCTGVVEYCTAVMGKKIRKGWIERRGGWKNSDRFEKLENVEMSNVGIDFIVCEY